MQTHRIKVLGQAGQDSGSRRSWPETQKKRKTAKNSKNPPSNKGRRQKQQPSCPESRTFGQVKVTCKVAGMSESRNVGGVENSSQPQLVRIIGDLGRVAAATLSSRGWPTSRCRGELGALLPAPRGVHWKQVGRIFCTGSEFIPAISGWQTDLKIDRLIQRQLAARSWLVHLSSPVSPMSIEAPPAPFTCHCHRLRRGCWLTFAYKAADMAISIAIANAKREMRKISSSSSRIVATYFKCQTSKLHTGNSAPSSIPKLYLHVLPPSLFLLDCFLALWLTYQKANIITPNASPGISRVALLVGVLAIIFDFFCDFCSRRRRPRRRRRRRTWPLYTCQWHLWPHSRASVYPTVGRLVVSPVVAVPDVACCSVAVAVAVAAYVAAAIAVFVWLNRYYGLPTTLVNMPPEHRPYDGLWMGELGSVEDDHRTFSLARSLLEQ
ncbi:GM14368 [Drosophila sechellia]|uniref:GM14368 n=1 Tax=Drosophila sechellia TaxID=7238 RepID=B4HXQ1_DROSE|nr:GM14368 [Drosophila sechellia]